MEESRTHTRNSQPQISNYPKNPTSPSKDLLTRLEIYLAKRDGIDKLLKISRYAAKVILASSLISGTQHHLVVARLKSFESSVGVSRKAFRLGKFIQDFNALRSIHFTSHRDLNLVFSIIAYGGEGLYYFIEQLVWLAKAGLIDNKYLKTLQRWSAWCEFVGYFGSVSLKMRELRRISEEERVLLAIVEEARSNGIECEAEQGKLKKLKEKKIMKKLSTVQDSADWLMALADIRDGKGWLAAPPLVSSAGLLSALISTHKNWVSC